MTSSNGITSSASNKDKPTPCTATNSEEGSANKPKPPLLQAAKNPRKSPVNIFQFPPDVVQQQPSAVKQQHPSSVQQEQPSAAQQQQPLAVQQQQPSAVQQHQSAGPQHKSAVQLPQLQQSA